MSIPPDSPWRGCAAAYPQPLDSEAERRAQSLQERIYYFNCRLLDPPLNDIVYRNSTRDADIRSHVFRWDRAHYHDVFRNGFQARRQQNTPDNIFYSLDHYIHHGGRPLVNSMRPANYAFVSTTLYSGWFPSVQLGSNEDEIVTEAWRYEIYAPGGIWVSETLGQSYQFPSQNEICFAGGIAPEYIRSAQLFRLTTNRRTRYTRRERADNVLVLNYNFNPQSHPQRLIDIQRPICYYRNENGRTEDLSLSFYSPAPRNNTSLQRRGLLETLTSSSIENWYTDKVTNLQSYMDSAFRSSRTNEAYIFMKNEYLLLNYAPGSTRDRVVNGPLLISEGFPSLKGTPFAEYGIDCAFGLHNKNESIIFFVNTCARINYAPGTTNDYIIDGPMIITRMFPFFKKTLFEDGVDAAFESSTTNEAYLFKGDQYALINYTPGSPRLIAIRTISQGFGGLRSTIFESGIDAAFASHRCNEAYLFKGDSYALVNFAPASTNDYVIGGVKKILPNWPSLQPILPRRNNRGVDLPMNDDEPNGVADHRHGEL
ncbi:hypothetical protein SOVF_213550 [Spinacia oleracea]|uniref:Pierisin-like domain-containing protein n=1 Tax=Spinacia oleracea TaxID=3562 RepID=A0A9R0IX05_SPIOL|nr:uncharacterized protein LOC110795966 [Spinacia oleracea]KNA02972.1 hypothetical protein SOVF_213550 [Spinacia oleracea]